MGAITKEAVQEAVNNQAYSELVAMFDESPERVRRFITRLTFLPGSDIHSKAVHAFKELSRARSEAHPDFFKETIRRHVWAMNDEGANDDWAAPEIICAIIAGNLSRYRGFITICYEAARDELMFQPSLLRGLDVIAEESPEALEPFADAIEKLRSEVGSRDDYLVRSPDRE